MRTCSIPGCGAKHKAYGYCIKHYRRWQAHGDPLHRDGAYGAGITDYKGYRRTYRPDHPLAGKTGYVAEHRLVAWEAGLLVNSSDVVHHLNGDKLDNRLENLAVTDKRAHDRDHAPGRSRDERGRFTGWRPMEPNCFPH